MLLLLNGKRSFDVLLNLVHLFLKRFILTKPFVYSHCQFLNVLVRLPFLVHLRSVVEVFSIILAAKDKPDL